MRQGKYWRIPEGPADLERLWADAEPLDPARLPAWLTPEDAPDYRHLGSSPAAAELEELAAVGLIVEPDPARTQLHDVYIERPRPDPVYSIGIYAGTSPLTLAPAAGARNPVLAREDVTDVPALFVADPFLLRARDTWHLFFEVMNWRENKGEIGLATSADGLRWAYRRIVLAEPFHLSYPHVLEFGGEYYLIPESYQAGSVRLYRATDFPLQWTLAATLLEAPYLVDASVFRHAGRWWMFAESNHDRHDTLRLYHASDLLGPWVEHPRSPVIANNPHTARPAGRVLAWDGRLIRFAQNCAPDYGTDVRAFEITELTMTTYREREVEGNPLLSGSGSGWNAGGMHHVDAHPLPDGRWIACVDGWRIPESL
jgi:hypothetical protein